MKRVTVGVLGGLLVATTAQAHIPPAAFIVKTLAAKRAGLKAVRFKSTVNGLQGDHITGARFRQTTIYDLTTRTLRSTAEDEVGRPLYAVERKLVNENAAPVLDSLLLESQTQLLAQHLRSVGVPVRTEEEIKQGLEDPSFLSRVKNGFAWVIGTSRKPDAQLWIEKDTFLPLKLAARRDGTPYEATFDGYRFYRELPLPRMITLAMGVGDDARPLLREEIMEVQVLSDPSEARAQVVPGYTDAGNSIDASVRDLIRSYYQYLR
jgi:hypothetical protein